MLKRVFVIAVVVVSGVLGFVVARAAASDAPVASPVDAVPQVPANPAGRSEQLVLVIGGVYSSRAQAESAAEESSGELQGLYVAPASDFDLLALYADAVPARSALACDTAVVGQPGTLPPELAQVAGDGLRRACKDAPSGVLNIVRDIKLVRVPVQVAVTANGASRKLGCEADSVCESAARRALGAEYGWPADAWLTVSGFRTKRGAAEFMTYLREFIGLETFAVQVRRTTGESDIGLGQEAHPNGSGPALGPLADQDAHQQ